MNRARIRTLPGASANARQTLTFSLAYVRLMIATSTCSSKTHHANRGSSSQIPFPKSEAVASFKEHITTRLTDLSQNLLLLLVTLVFYYLTYINTTNEKELTSSQVFLRQAFKNVIFSHNLQILCFVITILRDHLNFYFILPLV